MRFLYKPVATKPGHCVAKLRNQCIEVVDLFQLAFPGATKLFLYRNALDWVRSIYRLASRYRVPADCSLAEVIRQQRIYANRDFTYLQTYFKNRNTLTAIETMTLWWLNIMERQLYFHRQGFSFNAWRYEDLIRYPEDTLQSIFSHCGLPLEQLNYGLDAFKQDSRVPGSPELRQHREIKLR